VAAYDDTLTSLLDVHAPYPAVRRSTRSSQDWFDADCRAAKRTTRSLERVYRRHRTADTLAAWKNQFSTQRRLFRQKASDYWSTTTAECAGDAQRLWFKTNKVTKPPTVSQFTHTEYDLAKHFTSKVDKIRASTRQLVRRISAAVRLQCCLLCRRSSTWQSAKSTSWFGEHRASTGPSIQYRRMVKRAADVLAPVITTICKASLQSG